MFQQKIVAVIYASNSFRAEDRRNRVENLTLGQSIDSTQMIKNRIVNINAIKAEIDEMFSERILKSETTDKDVLLSRTQREDTKLYAFRIIDAAYKDALLKIVEGQLERFYLSHPEILSVKKVELFKTQAIERARELQAYFPNFLKDGDHKGYYNKLEKRIECIKNIPNIWMPDSVANELSEDATDTLNSRYAVSVMNLNRYQNDFALNSDYKSILHLCTTASYERGRMEAVAKIRELIAKHSSKKELLIKDFTYDIAERIDELKHKYPNNALIKQKIVGANHILNWFKSGMGEYHETKKEGRITKTKTDEDYRREVLQEAMEFEMRRVAPKRPFENDIQTAIEMKKALEKADILAKEFEEKFDTYNDEQKSDLQRRAKELDDVLSTLHFDSDKPRRSGLYGPFVNAKTSPPIEKIEKKKRADKLQAPAIGLFCECINESKALSKSSNENIADYCMKVCEKYELKYTERVRQNFSGSFTKENKQKVIDLIFPLLDKKTVAAVKKVLQKKEENH
jgi:hypothetical protein